MQRRLIRSVVIFSPHCVAIIDNIPWLAVIWYDMRRSIIISNQRMSESVFLVDVNMRV